MLRRLYYQRDIQFFAINCLHIHSVARVPCATTLSFICSLINVRIAYKQKENNSFVFHVVSSLGFWLQQEIAQKRFLFVVSFNNVLICNVD